MAKSVGNGQAKADVRSTTKNAHTQEKREIFAKKDRFIYLIRYTALAQARLKAKCWVADDKVKPSNYGSLLTIVLLSGKPIYW
jgi:hypothetical protein